MTDDCTVCNNATLLMNATCNDKDFRWNLLKTLCYLTDLLTQQEQEVEPESTILPQALFTALQVEAGFVNFASIGLLDTTKQLNHIDVLNTTDGDLYFSFDGGVTIAFTVPAGKEYKDDFNLTLGALTSVQMKRVGGEGPSAGYVVISGRYE